MKVTVAELNEVWSKLIHHLHEQNVDVIEIDVDYYWDISCPECYEMRGEPSTVVGQLSDDWRDLNALLSSQSAPLVNNFIDLAAILKAIGCKGESFIHLRSS